MSELTNNTTVNEDMTFEEMLENSLKKVITTGDRVKRASLSVLILLKSRLTSEPSSPDLLLKITFPPTRPLI